jgi:hypothetical protein
MTKPKAKPAVPRKLKAGDSFKIIRSSHWGSGKTFVCHKIERQTVHGYDSDIDLGEMVVFWAHFKPPGKPGWHAVPVSWCVSLGPAVPLNGRAAKRQAKTK